LFKTNMEINNMDLLLIHTKVTQISWILIKMLKMLEITIF
jgi:hypothetical protein